MRFQEDNEQEPETIWGWLTGQNKLKVLDPISNPDIALLPSHRYQRLADFLFQELQDLQQSVDQGISKLQAIDSLIKQFPHLTETLNEKVKVRISKVEGLVTQTKEELVLVLERTDIPFTEKIHHIERILQDTVAHFEELEKIFVADMTALIDQAACQTVWPTNVCYGIL